MKLIIVALTIAYASAFSLTNALSPKVKSAAHNIQMQSYAEYLQSRGMGGATRDPEASVAPAAPYVPPAASFVPPPTNVAPEPYVAPEVYVAPEAPPVAPTGNVVPTAAPTGGAAYDPWIDDAKTVVEIQGRRYRVNQ